MLTNNEDPKGTAFSVSVDAVKGKGTFPWLDNLFTGRNAYFQ
jgi:3,4-dihydroxy-2-butanone 4-phosphate synthase